MLVIIDRGHGIDTKGKRSPDGLVFEWEWADKFANNLVKRLKADGVCVSKLVKDANDVPLMNRVHKANLDAECAGVENTLLLSVHCNAQNTGNGIPLNARGFNAFVAPNASYNSRWFARELQAEMWKAGYRGNRADSEYLLGNFAICRDVKCPAVLAEYLFMTNSEDVKMLLSDEHRNKMLAITVDVIERYINKFKV